MTFRAEDAEFPYRTQQAVASSSVPTPPSGCVTHFVDSADGLHKSMDDQGTVTVIGNAAPAAVEVVLADATANDYVDIVMPFAGTITGWIALADVAGDCVVDVWKASYADYPPDDTDSITDSNEIALSSAQKGSDTTLTGWTTTFAAGDILRVHLDSCATLTQVTISLTVQKSG